VCSSDLEIGKFKYYLYRSCRNAAIDHVRKQTKEKTYSFSALGTKQTNFSYFKNFEDTTSQDALSKLEAADDTKYVREMLQMIPEEQREVIILRNWGNIKFAEIAKLTGSDVNTVQARFRYGIKNMQKLMKLHQIEISMD
jgi:RNA polymerase sigma-70 factor (ECF subfamily)